jgi:tight adherence protein B
MDSTQIIVIVIAAVVAVGVIIWGVINVRTEKDLIQERLERIEQAGDQPGFNSMLEIDVEDNKTNEKKQSALSTLFDNTLSERRFGKTWKQQLARADLKLTISEYAALHVIGIFGGFLVGYFVLFGQQLVMGVVAAFVGFFAPRIFVARKTATRLIQFENQLPDTIGLWVNALRSGYSVLQSMEAIARDAPEPTSTEFRRVVQEVQLGIDMEDALEHLLNRLDSEDLDLVITAVNIQREVGGNLAEILDVISHTIRERIKLKGEIRVLTAQGRITGYLISFLPIVLALFLYTINPEYMGNLFENQMCGWPLLGCGLALIGIGFAVVQKIVDIDI